MKKNLNKPINYKLFSIDAVKSFDVESRTVSGYLIKWDVKDSYDDIIRKGATLKSIKEHGVDSTSPQKIIFLYMHDMAQPIGSFTKLEEDPIGLYFEAEIDNIPLGDQVLTQYASGTLNQHSIGFRYIWDKTEYDSETDTYYLYEIQLLEGSVVSIGANPETPFMGFKSDTAENLEIEKQKISIAFEKVLKTIEIEQQKKIRQIVAKYMTLHEVEPLEEKTLEVKEAVNVIDWSDVINELKKN